MNEGFVAHFNSFILECGMKRSEKPLPQVAETQWKSFPSFFSDFVFLMEFFSKHLHRTLKLDDMKLKMQTQKFNKSGAV